MSKLLKKSIELNDIVIHVEYKNHTYTELNKNVKYALIQRPLYQIRLIHLLLSIFVIFIGFKLMSNSSATKQTNQNEDGLILNLILDRLDLYERSLKRTIEDQNTLKNYIDKLIISVNKPIYRIIDANKEEIFNKLKEYVDQSINTYNSDKTGMPDFASESVGGSIMFTKCVSNYVRNVKWFTLFGFAIFRLSVSPRVIIQNQQIQPGKCWAFVGQARVFIKLAARIFPKQFSIEHIPKSLSLSGRIDSAPRNFSVFGYVNQERLQENNRILLGNYVFDTAIDKTLQFFTIQNLPLQPISIIELYVQTNNGNDEYTCLYKFRVHGEQST